MGLYETIKEALVMVKGVASSDVTIKLNDALLQVNDMLDLSRKLKEENSELKQRLEIKNDDIEEEGYIVRKSNGDKDIKYCPTCWGEKEKLIPFQKHQNGFYQCRICNTSYKIFGNGSSAVKSEFEPY